jgi:hypothetical protein
MEGRVELIIRGHNEEAHIGGLGKETRDLTRFQDDKRKCGQRGNWVPNKEVRRMHH